MISEHSFQDHDFHSGDRNNQKHLLKRPYTIQFWGHIIIQDYFLVTVANTTACIQNLNLLVFGILIVFLVKTAFCVVIKILKVIIGHYKAFALARKSQYKSIIVQTCLRVTAS